MKNRILFSVFLVILILVVKVCSYAVEVGNISDALLTLREKAERGVSYFITGDYENAITSLNEAINFADGIISAISNESSTYEVYSEEVLKFVPDKSELITSIRRYTTEAVKAYIVGRIDRVIEKVLAIQNILKIVLNKAIEIQSSSEKSKASSDGKSNVTNLEKEVLTQIKGLGEKLYSMRVRVINVTNIVSKTNVIVHEENVFSTKYLWYVVGGFAFVFVVLLLIFLRYRFVKKRMEDLSDLL